MIGDIKRSHEDNAAKITNWKTINKNELINACVKEQDPMLKDAYISAIILRYWNVINTYYFKSYRSVSIDTCYDWLVGAVLYALNRHKWLDKESPLYGDPCGPDKVMNRVFFSTRMGFYQASNTAKRKGNYGAASVEELIEIEGDAAPLPNSSMPDEGYMDVNRLTRIMLNNKEYMIAFIIDGIINYDTYDRLFDDNGKPYTVFSEKKLAHHLRMLDNRYAEDFAKRFELNRVDICEAVSKCKNLTRQRLHTSIKRTLKTLSRNPIIKGMRG